MMLKGLGKLWIIRLDVVGIGFISIYDLTENPFIFYAVLSAYRNKGYMKKALRMIENLGLPPLYSQIDKKNSISLPVQEVFSFSKNSYIVALIKILQLN